MQVTDLDGGVWKFGYDASHQMTSETDPLGNTTTTSYDSSNRVASQTDPASRTRTFDYPYAGETIITNPGGDTTLETFNSAELPTTITRGYGSFAAATEHLSYDSSPNLVSDSDGNGNTTSYTYDSAGDRLTATDALGHRTTWTYDAQRDVTSMTDPDGNTTTYAYQNGELISVTRTLAAGP